MRLSSLFILLAASAAAQTLQIYAIDTEGGKATLYVSPSGESMLVDTGYAGNNNRDANRIAAAAAAAGVKRIDILVITHYHGDHASGLAQLAAKLPIGRIYDHGDNIDRSNAKTEAVYGPYEKARKPYPHQSLKVGDTIPLPGVQVTVVASDGETLANALPGAGQANPLCATAEILPPDKGENGRSIALMMTFGKLHIADLGDLYWDKELELVCPTNKLGTVDLYMTTHHGTATSGSPQIVHALHPKVAIMNNGEEKGGSVKALTAITSSPGLQDLWQLHFSAEGGKEHNADGKLIANPSAEGDEGFSISVVALADGTFKVRNNRNQFEKSYGK